MEEVPARRREYELHDACAEVFAQFVEYFITLLLFSVVLKHRDAAF